MVLQSLEMNYKIKLICFIDSDDYWHRISYWKNISDEK